MPAKIYLPAKQPKYRAKPTVVDGIRFASQKEARRYGVLKLRQQAGEISELDWQVSFSIDINGVHVCRYVADFVYNENGLRTVEDTKGFRTAEYKLKRKLMWACHGIIINEV